VIIAKVKTNTKDTAKTQRKRRSFYL